MLVVMAPALQPWLAGNAGLGRDDDADHHIDRFTRILAARGLARQHDYVGPVDDRVGDVAGFGSRRPWALDHRLQHLRGGNDRFAPYGSAMNHPLLDDRETFRLKL